MVEELNVLSRELAARSESAMAALASYRAKLSPEASLSTRSVSREVLRLSAITRAAVTTLDRLIGQQRPGPGGGRAEKASASSQALRSKIKAANDAAASFADELLVLINQITDPRLRDGFQALLGKGLEMAARQGEVAETVLSMRLESLGIES